jgi:hypothetical protein
MGINIFVAAEVRSGQPARANSSQTAGFDGCRDCVLAVELHLR